MKNDQQPDQPTAVDATPPVNPQPVAAESEPATTGVATPATTERATPPVVPPPAAPPKKSKKLFVIILAVIVVLLVGGAAAAYKFWYQNPEKVVGDGLAHALTEQGPVTSTGTLTVDTDDVSVGVTLNGGSKNGEASGDSELKIMMKSGDLKGQSLTLKGSGVYLQDGTVYFKASGVKEAVASIVDLYVDSLAKQYKDYGYAITDAQKAEARSSMHESIDPIVAKFDNQWIKVTADDIKQQDEDAAKQYTCATDAFKQLRDEKNLKELSDVYQKNKFLTVGKALGSKDGSLGYEVAIDKAKAKAFDTASDDTAIVKAFDKCDEDNKTSSTDDSDIDDVDTTSFQLWVSRWSHKITRTVYEGTYTDKSDNNTKTTMKLDMSFDYSKPVDVKAPEGAKPLKDIIDSLQSIGTDASTAV